MGDSIRNIERIQENEVEQGIPRSVTLALVVLGGGCVVFAALAFTGRTSGVPEKKSDPLGDLLVRRSGGPASSGAAVADLSPREVTFPQMLSDGEHPSTALAAVRPLTSAVQGAPSGAPQPAPSATQPPPATDRLPVVPLPAQSVLEATPIVTRPRDTLTRAAGDMAKIEGATSPPGHEGAYQLQVSSFHTQGEAQSFADQLRARGHKAYVVEANVAGRGTWYRVRIGPFATPRAATEYRADFESKEHVVPFVVTPEMTKGH